MDIHNALASLKPNCKYVQRGNDYTGLEWLDETQAKPTESQINAEIARLQADYDARQYQRDRAAEYPPFADQFDTLYHGGYDAWKAQIDAIKLKYPKA